MSKPQVRILNDHWVIGWPMALNAPKSLYSNYCPSLYAHNALKVCDPIKKCVQLKKKN